MSRTKCYDKDGNEIDMEDYLRDAPTYAQEQLAEIERREAVDHPDYYKRGGIEVIDAIKEQEEYYGVNAYCMSRMQLLTVAAKLIDVTEDE